MVLRFVGNNSPIFRQLKWSLVHIAGLVQYCSNSRALAMELLQSCTKPSISPLVNWLNNDWGNDLTPVRHQAITWINVDFVERMYLEQCDINTMIWFPEITFVFTYNFTVNGGYSASTPFVRHFILFCSVLMGTSYQFVNFLAWSISVCVPTGKWNSFVEHRSIK